MAAFTVNALKLQTLCGIFFLSKYFCLCTYFTILDGKVNSADPHQTLLQEPSNLGLHSLHMPFYKTTPQPLYNTIVGVRSISPVS